MAATQPFQPIRTRGERQRRPLQQCRAIGIVRRGSVHAAMAALMRDTVPLPTPTAYAAFLIPSPAASRARTAASTFAPVLGRPRRTPRARARSSPAMTRLRIIPRSNSANAPVTWKNMRPAGVVVSIACWCWTSATAAASSSFSVRNAEPACWSSQFGRACRSAPMVLQARYPAVRRATGVPAPFRLSTEAAQTAVVPAEHAATRRA